MPAVKGGRTCRMHGGKSLRGADHKLFKHGLKATTLSPAERAEAQEIERQLLEDPKTIIIREAAETFARARAVARRADEGGMVTVKQTATQTLVVKRDEYGNVSLDPETKQPVMVPSQEVQHAERLDVSVPVAELQGRAARMVADAHLLEKKVGGFGGGALNVIDRETARDVMREVFGSGGALDRPAKGPDGEAEGKRKPG